MAETGTDSCNTQRRKNKILVTGGVGGVAGVLIIGGVIAVVNLFRYRASRKGSDVKNPNPNPKSLKTSDVHDDEGEGLRSLTQTASGASSSQISCDPEPEEAVIVQEDEPYTESKEETEISSSDQSHESGNTKPSTDAIRDEATDTISEVVPLTSSDGVPAFSRIDESHTLQSLPPEEATEYTDDEDEGEESEEEEESSDEDEDEVEREREDSEGTGDSSTGSNSEAIWPAESIEKELLLLKDRAPVKVSGENIKDSEKISKAEEDEFELMNRLAAKRDSGFELIHHINPSFLRSKPSLSVLLLLALGLLYLLFAHHVPLLFHPTDSQLSSSS